MSKITYKKLIRMDIEEYLMFIESSIKSEPNEAYFKKINKEIRKIYKIDSCIAINLLEANLKKFDELKKFNLYSMTLVEITKIYFNDNKVGEAINIFSKTIKYVCNYNMYKQGKEIITYIMTAISTSLISLKEDEYIYIIKCKIDFYRKFDKFKECVDSMCECAHVFAGNHAYQSAYRILSDAQWITMDNNLLDLQLKVLITQASICVQEGDYEVAKIDFDKAYSLSESLNNEIPFELMFNMGTLMIRNKDYEAALEVLDQIITKYDLISKEYGKHIKINKSICLREIGRLDESIKLIKEVFKSVEQLEDLEAILEAHLVAAKTYILSKNYNESLYHINESIQIIDFDIQYRNRLHYRRGFKERYIQRIINMALEVISKTNVDYKNVTRILAFTKSNMFSDWLSLLDWYDLILDDKTVEDVDKKSLKSLVEQLINLGAPILNGFREKYDDPFESIDNSIFSYDKPWKDFNIFVEKIRDKYAKYRNPYEYSEIDNLKEMMDKKVSSSTLYISLYLYDNKLSILIVSEYKCEVIELNKANYVKYIQDLYKYQNKSITFSQFVKSLNLITEELEKILQLTIISLIDNKIEQIIVLQDKFMHSIPLIPALISNQDLCEYIKNNEIVMKNSPIIYSCKQCKNKYDNFLGIIDPAEELPLLMEELTLHKKYIIGNDEIINLKSQKIDYNDIKIKSKDVIHIATHGYPISNFTDPTYASIAGMISTDSLYFEEIQRNFWKLNYSLCINASCDSADFSNRNYYRLFDTNELIGYSTLFLMNRKSSTISVNWPIKDILSYAYLHIFYKNLNETGSIERAYTISLVDLMELDKNSLKDIISSIDNTMIREEKLKLIDNIQVEYPFRDPYCYGAFTINSLV